MDDITRALTLGVAAPLIATTLVLFVIWRGAPARTRPRAIATAVALPILLALGWILGLGAPEFPPSRAMGWVLPISVGAAVVSILGVSPPLAWLQWIVWILRTGILLAGLWLMGQRRTETAPVETWIAIGAHTLAGLGGMWSLDRAGRDNSSLSLWLIVAVGCSACAAAGLSGNIQPAIAPAILCAVVGPAILVRPFAPALRLESSASFGAVFLTANWFVTWPLGYTPWISNALLAFSLIAVTLPLPDSLPPRIRTPSRIALVVIPGLAATGWAYLATRGNGY
jgi:hypothetical protein